MKQIIFRFYDYFLCQMRLKSKFMVTHLFLALVPAIVIASFTYSRFSSIITTNTMQSLEVISEQTQSSMESVISRIHAAGEAMKTQNFLLSFLQNRHPESYYHSSSFLEQLENFQSSAHYFIDGDTITDIRIYLDWEHWDILNSTAPSPLFDTLAAASGSYWHGIMRSSRTNTLVCPGMYLSPTEISNCGDLAIINRLRLADNSEAYVAVYFSQESIDSILAQDIPFTDSVMYINNEREAIVSTTNATLSGTYYLTYHSIPESIRTTRKFVKLTFADELVYVGYKAIEGTDWYMVSAIPATNVVSEGNTLLLEFIVIYVVFLCISTLVSLLLSNSIIKRLSSIIHQMKNVRQAPPKRLEVSVSRDEIGDLVDTYNYMSDELNHLMQEQLKSAQELRLSEFKALQAQINPHFLYNTLDMINWMAKSGKSREVSEAVQILSRFYKLTLSRGNVVVKVRDEVEHVTLYVKLQNMRYDNKIHFFVDIPDEMLDFEIPKLLFQPIVENSILHGIFEKDSMEGTIVIMGWIEEEELVFVLSDDGVGIPKDKLSTLLDGSGKSETGSNIGIYNTHKRLLLFCNTGRGLSYRSSPNQGTEVELRIPVKK